MRTEGAGPARPVAYGAALVLAGVMLAACAATPEPAASGAVPASGAAPASGPATGALPAGRGELRPGRPEVPAAGDSTAAIRRRHHGQVPRQWGLDVDGVVLRSSSPAVALTLDACGGPQGDGVDRALLAFLSRRRFPATLFVNSRWVRAHRALTLRLAANPLFELANHGTSHRPLSVSGQAAYGIPGTTGVAGVIAEVRGNQRLLTRLTGSRPRFFRAGTAHYDEVAAAVVRDLGEIPVNFDINADFGATAGRDTVIANVARARPGSIILAHFNQPAGATAEGLAVALPRLRQRGLRFATLSELGLR